MGRQKQMPFVQLVMNSYDHDSSEFSKQALNSLPSELYPTLQLKAHPPQQLPHDLHVGLHLVDYELQVTLDCICDCSAWPKSSHLEGYGQPGPSVGSISNPMSSRIHKMRRVKGKVPHQKDGSQRGVIISRLTQPMSNYQLERMT